MLITVQAQHLVNAVFQITGSTLFVYKHLLLFELKSSVFLIHSTELDTVRLTRKRTDKVVENNNYYLAMSINKKIRFQNKN